MTSSKNICFRCGKPRVVVSVTTEVIGNSTITNTETSCPDPDCQKKLDVQLEKEKQKRLDNMSRSAMNKGYRKPAPPTTPTNAEVVAK